MDEPTPPAPGSEPDFMPRMRRLFADSLPERLQRMRTGLDGVTADVAAGRPPSATDLEDLFLAAHSLKGTAPVVGAIEVGHDAGELSELAGRWSPDAPPDAEALGRARSLLERVAAACDAVVARTDAAT